MIATTLDNLIQTYIQDSKNTFDSIDPEKIVITTETLGEVLEKLLILNIRIWQLEDQASQLKQAGDLESYAQYKKKLDVCFKVKRPALVAAIDALLINMIKNPASADSTNIKLYK